MADIAPETVYWIDHFVVPVNDLYAYRAFMVDVFGAAPFAEIGQTTAAQARRSPIGSFYTVGRYHHNGGFLQTELLPAGRPLGAGVPRYGFYVRLGDLDDHRRRLDRAGIAASEPIRTSADGEGGIAIYFADKDGNQYEFWASQTFPEGAMENDNPTGIGRVSHVVQESLDLDRTSDFYQRYCGLKPIRSSDIAADTLALRLAGGGRLVFKLVDALSPRTGGHNRWKGQHIALTVNAPSLAVAYDKMWNGLPESDFVPYSGTAMSIDERTLPPRTELHGLEARGERRSSARRGTFVYDWDGNNFHLVGAQPLAREHAHYRVVQDENFQNTTAAVAL